MQGARASQPSSTNRSSSSPASLPRRGRGAHPARYSFGRPARASHARCPLCACQGASAASAGTRGENPPARPAAMEEGTHPDPFRTRKLSPPSPMVLRRKAVGEQDAAGLAGGFSAEAAGDGSRGGRASGPPPSFFPRRARAEGDRPAPRQTGGRPPGRVRPGPLAGTGPWSACAQLAPHRCVAPSRRGPWRPLGPQVDLEFAIYRGKFIYRHLAETVHH